MSEETELALKHKTVPLEQLHKDSDYNQRWTLPQPKHPLISLL